jgi:hypothetical protein
VLGVNFVVDVGIETAEAVVSGIVGDVGPYGLRFHVLQIDDSGGNGVFVLVDHAAVKNFQLGFRPLLFLSLFLGTS